MNKERADLWTLSRFLSRDLWVWMFWIEEVTRVFLTDFLVFLENFKCCLREFGSPHFSIFMLSFGDFLAFFIGLVS